MKEEIQITKFINPHYFHFKFLHEFHDPEFRKFEFELQKYANEKLLQHNSEPSQPAVRDVIAAFESIWSKWVRAEVLSTRSSPNARIKLWAIDHNQPLQVSLRDVVPLPTEMKVKDIRASRMGGIRNCVPSELDLDVETLQELPKPKQEWSNKAIHHCMKLLRKSTTFFENYSSVDDYFFGDLIIQPDYGEDVNISEVLIALDEAIAIPNFSEVMPEIQCRYKNLHRRSKEKVKKSYSELASSVHADDHTKDKTSDFDHDDDNFHDFQMAKDVYGPWRIDSKVCKLQSRAYFEGDPSQRPISAEIETNDHATIDDEITEIKFPTSYLPSGCEEFGGRYF